MSKPVKSIPDGYHSITPYLVINGASKAIDFYKKAFGAKEISRLEMPDGKLGHAEIKIGDSRIMICDQMMDAKDAKTLGGSPVMIHLYVEDVDKTTKDAASAGGKLDKPPEDMFYGDRAAKVTDPFGHIWWVSTHVEDVSEDETKRRADKMFKDCGTKDKKKAA